MVGMSDIEIPISYVWRDTSQIYIHTQPSVEISCVFNFTHFYYLKVAVTGLMKTLLTASKERCRVVVAGFVWCPAQPTNMLPSPVNLF